jgi:hypothetical protein
MQFGEALQNEVAMSAVAAMARVQYEDVRSRVPISLETHKFYGRDSKRTGVVYEFAPGALRNAIYRTFSAEKSGPHKKLYRISWNHRKAPYGFMVEYGTVHAAPVHFMHGSLSRIGTAINAGKARIAQKLQEMSV